MGDTIQGQLVSLIILIVKNDSIINVFLYSHLNNFCLSFKRPMSSRELNSPSIYMLKNENKKSNVDLLQQLNILLCACVHVYVCIGALVLLCWGRVLPALLPMAHA